jgi:hypothetical protein
MVEHAETDEAILACYDVMAELRLNISREAFLPTVRSMQKEGLRLACIREGGRVVAVAGYRVSTNLYCNRHLYVDDLVTAEAERSKGHGKVLLAWLRAATCFTSIPACSASARTSSTCAKASSSAATTSASG